SLDLVDATLPPGPYRRTDVVRGADAALAQPQLQPQIEIGCVDADHQIRSPVQEVGAQRAAHSQQLRQALERLDKSHHGETLDIEKAGEVFLRHQRSANAAELEGPTAVRAQRTHQVGAENIAGCFADDNADTQGRGGRIGNGVHCDQRTMPRVERVNESTSNCTSGCAVASVCSSTSASSTVRFWR